MSTAAGPPSDGGPGGGPPAAGPPLGGPPLTPEQLAMLPHDNLGPMLLGVAWMMVLLSSMFLALRVYCKFIGNHRLWWDDYILTASWLVMTIDVALTSYLVSLGYGRHTYDFPPENFPKFGLTVLVRGTFAITALAWSKTAFGVTLLRLTNGWMKWIVWSIIVTVNVSLGLSAMLPWVQCNPIYAAWDFIAQQTAKCWPQNVIFHYNIFSGAYSGAMDFALALLPWQLLMGLQMKRKEKIGAGIAMSMGILAGVAAIVKTIMLPKLYSADMYDSVQLFIWDITEGAITIIAASIPVLRVLVRDVRSTMRKYRGTNDPEGTVKSAKSRNKTNFDKLDEEYGSFGSTHSRDGPDPSDVRSDKSFLDDSSSQLQHQEGTILRTQAVTLRYETRKAGDNIELGRVPKF